MRRPSKTKAQRSFDRSQRALLRLRKASVRWSEGVQNAHADSANEDENDTLIELLTDMQAAADAYTTSLTPRERKRLLK